jgi:WD40 repeat protein
MVAPFRDTVFVSYSRADRKWLDRMLVFLKPYTRRGTFTLWTDRYIKAGGLWRREIDAALDRAAIGLVLVSPDSIASDFIHDVELPALDNFARRGLLQLLWVPVSPSAYDQTLLKDYQAVWDPTRTLDTLGEHDRNLAFVEIAQTLAATAERILGVRPVATPARRRRERPAVAAAPASERSFPGKLHDVPRLPPHYHPRVDDLAALRRSLLQGRSGAVGITGETSRVGLHGHGGIGKSVLAAALARDEEVRRAFPDGVHWVTLGQTPDLLRLQTELLGYGERDPASPTDAQQGNRLLEERFRDSAVLLVLDDVWDYRQAQLFDVLGPASRLLVTTRDIAVLTALGAEQNTVHHLPEAAALAMLATWSGAPGGAALPDAAHGVARECGYLPLALSLAGAQVKEGTSWEVVLKALEQGRLEFLDHPYESVFRSMKLGVDALSSTDRQRYLELAVLPEDARVPEAVVLALWKQTSQLDELAGQGLLTRLKGKALLELTSVDERREITLHDLQHDFLRISVPDLPALHAELLATFAAHLPTIGRRAPWWYLPEVEKYAWTHLAQHLVDAGRTEELGDLLFDARWLEAKLRTSGLPALLADFKALPDEEELSLLSGALRLSGHVLGRDPGELRSQLAGRLSGFDLPRIRGLLRIARVTGTGRWLRPGGASLTPPSGSLLLTLVGHTKGVLAVALTPDGRRAVSGSSDHTVKVWDLEMGTEDRTLAGHTQYVTAVALTADGRQAVSGSGDRTLKVWDVEAGTVKRTLTGHTEGITTVALTADGRRAVSGSYDKMLKVWDVETGKEERTLAGNAGSVKAVAVTGDGRRAVAAYAGAVGKVWNLETGEEEHSFLILSDAVALTADGRYAVAGSWKETLTVWDVERGIKERTLLGGHAQEILGVTVTADGRRSVSCSQDRTLKVWDMEKGAVEQTLLGHTAAVRGVAITPDGWRAVSASEDGTLKVWDLRTSAEQRSLLGHTDALTAIAVTSDGRRAASGSTDGILKVWHLGRGAEERTLASQRWLSAAAFAADGRRAVTGAVDGTLKVWNLKTGAEERTLEGHAQLIAALALTPDGRRAVSGSWDSTLKVWDVEKGTVEHTLGGDLGWVTAVAIAADGRRAVSNSLESLKVWNLETGGEERTLAGHTGMVTAVGLTPDGKRAVSGSEDWTLKVWDMETGLEEQTLVGHRGPVSAVALTVDGRRAVSAGDDYTLKVWDLEDRCRYGCLLASFTADAPLRCCAFMPDGVRLLAGDRLGRIHFLTLEEQPPRVGAVRGWVRGVLTGAWFGRRGGGGPWE